MKRIKEITCNVTLTDNKNLSEKKLEAKIKALLKADDVKIRQLKTFEVRK